MEVPSRFENDFVILEIENGIMRLTYKAGATINLDNAKTIVQKRLQLTNKKAIPVIIDDIGFKGIEKDARDYLSSDEGIKGISAAALVSKSVFSAYLANFFLKISFYKPKMPARVFKDESEARKWLIDFV